MFFEGMDLECFVENCILSTKDNAWNKVCDLQTLLNEHHASPFTETRCFKGKPSSLSFSLPPLLSPLSLSPANSLSVSLSYTHMYITHTLWNTGRSCYTLWHFPHEQHIKHGSLVKIYH